MCGDLLTRFMDKVEVDSITGCHNWTAALYETGYGMFSVERVPHLAHRVVYELLVGPIPYGKMVLHHCDNRKCVNPDHLYTGTHQNNMDDMVERGRSKANGLVKEKHPRAKLTWEEVNAIRNKYSIGFTQVVLAEEYGVCQVQVSSIVRGETW